MVLRLNMTEKKLLEEASIRGLIDEGYNLKDIAAKIGVTVGALRYFNKKHGILGGKTKTVLREKDVYYRNPRQCKNCHKILPFIKRNNVFCSNSCSASFNNIGINRHNTTPNSCRHCGNDTSGRNVFCDKCIEDGFHLNYNRVTRLEEAKTNRSRRRIIIDIRGYCCESCGNSKWMGQPITLELHHIDGNSDNNVSDNLQLLCPNCHSQTETYRAGNIGNGSSRSSYRKRYYDGN